MQLFTFKELREGEALTCIHGKVYSLKEFVRKHPGGEIIENAIGVDATALFESYHSLSTREYTKLLQRYQVGVMKDYRPVANFDTEFSRELKAECKKYMAGKLPRQHITNPLLIAFSLFFMTSSLLYLCLHPNWLAAVLVGVASTYNLFLSHMAAHYSLSRSDRINQWVTWTECVFPFSVASPSIWRMSHVLGHHLYPNTTKDYSVEGPYAFKSRGIPEESRFRFLLLNLIHLPWSAMVRHFNILRFSTDKRNTVLVYALGFLFNLVFYFLSILQALSIIMKKTPQWVKNQLAWEEAGEDADGIGPWIFRFRDKPGSLCNELAVNGISHLVYFVLVVGISGISIFHCVLLFGLVSFVKNILYSFGENPTHHFDGIADVAVKELEPTTDWYRHTIENTSDSTFGFHAPKWVSIFLGQGFMSLHTAHHCFPGVAVGHLYHLSAIIQQVCHRHGVRYREVTSLLELWRLMRKNPAGALYRA